MALSVNNGSVLQTTTSPIADYPFSIVGWFRVPDVSFFLPLARLRDSATGARYELYFGGHQGDVAAANVIISSSAPALSSAAMVPGTWHHVAGVFVSATERWIYLDGGAAGESNVSRVFAGADIFEIGYVNKIDYVDAAEVAVVASALSPEAIASLAHGFSLLGSAAAGDVVAYYDCIRSVNRPGLGPPISSGGTPLVVPHPRIFSSLLGRSVTQSARVRGPLRVEPAVFRPSTARQGQFSVSGVDFSNSILPGEVTS